MAHVWIVIVATTPLIAAFMSQVPAADLAYQIRAGDIMLRTHSLLRADVFTFTVPGKQWLNQQWGAELLLTATHRLGGWNAIVLLYAALASIAFVFVFLACRRRGASTRAAALLSVAGFWVARQNLAMRPQLIAVVLFSLTLWILAGRRSKPRAMWAVPALMIIWVNVHGSFVLVPLLFGLVWLEDRKDFPQTARTILAVGATSVVATLANPFGLSVWSYAAGIGTNATIARATTEWAPPTIHEYSGIVFFASALIVTCYLLRRKEPLAWPQLLWLASFFVLALPALRGVVWWGLVFPFVIAGHVKKKTDAEEEDGSSLMNAVLATTFLAAAIVVMPFWREASPTGAPPFLAQAPVSLVDATESRVPAGSRVFVSQTYASWFELALPTMPVFTDSRIELYPTSIWDTYFELSSATEGWQATLDRWNVAAVVINPDQDETLATHMLKDPGWQLAFRDESGYVFVRS
jgi:hypothetical protein